MKTKSNIKKQGQKKIYPKTKDAKAIKSKKVKNLYLNRGNIKNEYQTKLNKIEEIYKNYINQYSKIEEERNRLFDNFVKKIEQKKIELLHKEIN